MASTREYAMSRLHRAALMGLAICSMGAVGQCPDPNNRAPNLQCGDFSVWVLPGTCEALTNTCGDGRWAHPPDYAGFRLEGAPASVYIRTERAGRELTGVSLCAASGAGSIAADSVVFVYGSGDGFGTGHVTINVSPRLVADVSATPEVIGPDGSSQLVAIVSGGIPPYSYSWIPTSGLNKTNIPIPVASPSVTTTYSLSVTDSAGQYLGLSPGQNPGGPTVPATVTVRVNRRLDVSANPRVISAGDGTQLNAFGQGGRLPYTFSWVPVETLDDPTISNPVAQPAETTTYTVTVTDADGTTLTGSVTAWVSDMLVYAVASPQVVKPGESSQLSAEVLGGTPPYSFSWAPIETLDRPTAQNPIAAPAASTYYAVTVTDDSGRPDPLQRTVKVSVSDMEVSASAAPQAIDIGGSSQLSATAQGGRPPYGVLWSPADGLDDRTRMNPIASPAVTTTYTALVCDQGLVNEAVCLTRSVTVTVNPPTPPPPPISPPTASFTFSRTCCPATLTVDASASTGNIAFYVWDLSWTPASPDLETTSPTATFTFNEGDRGTITLTVTAADGQTATTKGPSR